MIIFVSFGNGCFDKIHDNVFKVSRYDTNYQKYETYNLNIPVFFYIGTVLA